jgi:hypothetical protein
VLGRPASAGRRRNATRHAAQRGAAMLAAPLQEEIMNRLLSGGEKTRDRAPFRRPLNPNRLACGGQGGFVHQTLPL